MIKLNEDLELILKDTSHLWEGINGENFLITGGTGFFGKWLLSSFSYINTKRSLNNKLYVLSRNPSSFLKQHPEFSDLNDIIFIEGDVTTFEVETEITINYIIHAATDANMEMNKSSPLLMYDTIVNGTRNILEIARKKKVKAVLHTSSGAVYGSQPSHVTHITETYKGCPDISNLNAAYGEGKRVAEMLANFYYSHYQINSKIARCFAFVGPYLPLDGTYAIGNFIRDGLNERDINVQGDGTPYRSYLYASDLTTWLWTILFKGLPCEPYNVGSDKDLTIKELAKLIAGYNQSSVVRIATLHPINNKVSRYVPSIDKAKNELELKINVPLEKAIKKTFEFYNTGV
ncbi:NAD-dependent epimerase/dehydratase family protein [Mucilaginibacter terrae]|uniref:NAD-dependent epimerase/dehydratase family protein n=1 Tax=Mucilaginibacter terrae TaxID=1955052 RepID=UPI003637ADA7